MQGSALAQADSLHCVSGYFPLLCRGRLTLSSYFLPPSEGGTLVFFTSNDKAAGNSGATLASGTCAWVDRPVTQSEPKLVFKTYVGFFTTTAAAVDVSTNNLVYCAMNESCVLMGCAANIARDFANVLDMSNGTSSGNDIIAAFPKFK